MKYLHTLALLFLFLISTLSTAKNLSTENFSRLPAFQQVKLSPSGARLAFIHNTQAENGLAILTTFDIASSNKEQLIKSDNIKVKINWFRWANDDVLLISARYETSTNGGLYYQTRLLKIDLSKPERELKRVTRKRKKVLSESSQYTSQYQDNVIDILPDDPDHILMQLDYDTRAMPSVYKVNLNKARPVRIEKAKLNIRHWMTDQQNVVRVGRSRDFTNSLIKYYHRLAKNDEFEVLFQYDFIKDKPIHIMGFGLDPNILYYRAYNGNFRAVYKMDLRTKESELVLSNDGYDVDGRLIYSKKTNDVIGISNHHSEFGKYYFDDNNYALARGMKKALGNKSVRVVSFDQNENRYIALVQSDTSSPQYFFGVRKDKQIIKLFSQYPKLDNKEFSRHKKIKYIVRDNSEIEAYLTLPKFGDAPYPTVLHPHGGPGARDYSGFDPWVAFMVSKGYAVMRPNFRGSTGYGYEFAKAQMGRWGLEMQDDITDAAKWLIDEGIANPAKICVFGASYGGYVAKMATVKTPDLFTCAVSFAGISDLNKLVRNQKKYMGGKIIAKFQIGDNRKDLRERSPITFVEKIKTPLLVMHGDQDIIVDIEQSKDFIDELEDEDKVFKYVEFEYGDHYLSIQKNRSLFFEELDMFLEQHLGTPKEQ